MSTEEKSKIIERVSDDSRFFELYIRISIFGKVIFERTFPPNR